MHKTFAIATVSALALVGCSSSKHAATGSTSGTVVVFAAASLKNTFTTLATSFEKAHPRVTIVPSFGGSDTLAAQIVAGSPVDVFAAASTATMATVSNAHDAKSTPTVFAKNSLEIAVAPSNPLQVASLADLTKNSVKVAICAPTVPCGAAAAKAFASVNLKPNAVTQEQDVTSVLTKVELGEVDAGVVYQTDVKSAGAKVLGVNFPEAVNAINSYPIAVVTTGKNPKAAQAFVDYVRSADGMTVLQAAGFQQP